MNRSDKQALESGPTPGVEPTSGGAAAAIVAAGAGSFALGIFAVLGDASKAAAHALTFYAPTGPLSGVTSLAIALWLIVWAALRIVWGKKDVALGRTNLVAFIFLALGLLLTFPPFEDLLLGK